MPINREKREESVNGEDLLILRDPSRRYSHEQVCDLLERAEEMGFSLEKGSELESMTVGELHAIVTGQKNLLN